MLDTETEGIWPCFVHLKLTDQSQQHIHAWAMEALRRITDRLSIESDQITAISPQDLHVSITPTLLLQQHELEQMRSLVDSLGQVENLEDLKYDRSLHWSFLENTHIESCVADLRPFGASIGKLAVFGDYIALTIPCESDGREIQAVNAYFQEACAFYNQASYEEKCMEEGKRREFHCSIGKINAPAGDIPNLQDALRELNLQPPASVSIDALVLVN